MTIFDITPNSGRKPPSSSDLLLNIGGVFGLRGTFFGDFGQIPPLYKPQNRKIFARLRRVFTLYKVSKSFKQNCAYGAFSPSVECQNSKISLAPSARWFIHTVWLFCAAGEKILRICVFFGDDFPLEMKQNWFKIAKFSAAGGGPKPEPRFPEI